MGEDLRYGNSGNEVKEDPAILMARKTLAGKRYGGGPTPKCYGCGKEYEQMNNELKLVYLPKVKQQRKLCPDCLPLRDEIERKDEPKKQRIPDEPEAVIPLRADRKEPIKPLSAEIAKLPPPVKECLNCDSNLFYLLRGGIIKCSECGTEFKVAKGV